MISFIIFPIATIHSTYIEIADTKMTSVGCVRYIVLKIVV